MPASPSSRGVLLQGRVPTPGDWFELPDAAHLEAIADSTGEVVYRGAPAERVHIAIAAAADAVHSLLNPARTPPLWLNRSGARFKMLPYELPPTVKASPR